MDDYQLQRLWSLLDPIVPTLDYSIEHVLSYDERLGWAFDRGIITIEEFNALLKWGI